jgi:hypothetical protein
MRVRTETARRASRVATTNTTRTLPAKRGEILARILADALVSPAKYIERWVVNRGGE